MTYQFCKENCGAGPESIDWSAFLQQFSAWLLPWLALLSQLPYGAKHRADNLMSMLLAVGSPTLAAYSVALTILNSRWVADRFSNISYPNADYARLILSSLQHVSLKVTNEDGLLASLIVLPENDDWWQDLIERLDFTHTWSISAATSISWVFIAYIFTIVGTYTSHEDGNSLPDGPSVGSIWLWLLPVVIAWLQIEPKCDSRRLKKAMARANAIAFVATSHGATRLVTHARALSIEVRESGNSSNSVEDGTAPIFNYARFLPWTHDVEVMRAAFLSASQRAERAQRVDATNGEPSWKSSEDRDSELIHPDNRRGSLEQIVAYCTPLSEETYVRNGCWGPEVWSRVFKASVAALSLQWGTAGAAFIITYLSPTIGLGCHSGSYLIYAVVSMVVWMLLITSSMLNHYLSWQHQRSSSVPRRPLKSTASPNVLPLVAVLLRRCGMVLATLNAIWILLVCVMQFGNLFTTCYCNSSIYSLGSRAYYIVYSPRGSFLAGPMTGGVVLSLASVVLFVGFVNVYINPPR